MKSTVFFLPVHMVYKDSRIIHQSLLNSARQALEVFCIINVDIGRK